MKKLLTLLFVLVSLASFGQNTNNFTGIVIKNSHASDSSGINKIWYNAATAKFRFWDGTGKHTFGVGSSGAFWPLTGGASLTGNVNIDGLYNFGLGQSSPLGRIDMAATTSIDLDGGGTALILSSTGANFSGGHFNVDGAFNVGFGQTTPLTGFAVSATSGSNEGGIAIDPIQADISVGAGGNTSVTMHSDLGTPSESRVVIQSVFDAIEVGYDNEALSRNGLAFYTGTASLIKRMQISEAGVWTVNVGSDAIGDIYQRNASNNFSRLAAVATGNVLISGGVATVNAWGKVGLTTHVSGILPVANGGTATATPALVAGTNITITGTWPNQTINSSAGGGSNPFDDGTALVKGSADATKLLRFEVDGFTTGVTRVLTPPNFDGTIATLAGTETFTNKTLSGAVVSSQPAALDASLKVAPTKYVDDAVAAQAMAAFSTTVPGYVNLSGAVGSLLKHDNSWLTIGANATVLTSNGTTFSWAAPVSGGWAVTGTTTLTGAPTISNGGSNFPITFGLGFTSTANGNFGIKINGIYVPRATANDTLSVMTIRPKISATAAGQTLKLFSVSATTPRTNNPNVVVEFLWDGKSRGMSLISDDHDDTNLILNGGGNLQLLTSATSSTIQSTGSALIVKANSMSFRVNALTSTIATIPTGATSPSNGSAWRLNFISNIDATSAATQSGSHALQLRSTSWDGAAVKMGIFQLRNNISTTVNAYQSLQFGYGLIANNDTGDGTLPGTIMQIYSDSVVQIGMGRLNHTTASAVLDLQALDRGVIVPRTTTTPGTLVNGMQWYDANTNLWQFRQNGSTVAWWANTGTTAITGNTTQTGGFTNTFALNGIVITQNAMSSGWTSGFKVTSGAHTALTAATEFVSSDFDAFTWTWNSGTTTTERFRYFRSPTINSTSGTATFTNVYNVFIDPPVAGTTAAFTNGPFALGLGGTLQLTAGTTTKGSILFQVGTNLTTPLAGTIEYNNQWFFTVLGNTRMTPALANGGFTAGRIVMGLTTASVFDSPNLTFSTNRLLGTTLYLTVSAGATGAGNAPLKMTSGSLMTTAEAGGIEFLTDSYYATITTSAARKEIVLSDAALVSGRLPLITTNGRLTSQTGYVINTPNSGDLGLQGDLVLGSLGTPGPGIRIKEGSNASMGTATANGTTEVTVSTTKVTATSRIFIFCESGCTGVSGSYYISARTAGTSFGFKAAATDTGTVAWVILEPAP